MRPSIAILASFLIALSACKDQPPLWSVEIEENDAITIASVALSRGKIRGCGEVNIVSQSPLSKIISVECFNGKSRKNHEIGYAPYLKVDGIRVDYNNPWEEMGLSTMYCVKLPNGKWDKAFMDMEDARRRTVKLSIEHKMPVRFYVSDGNYYWESFQNSAGVWMTSVPTDEVRNKDERRGCEL